MDEETRKVKEELGVKWVKSNTGTTYLCPARLSERLASATDGDLRQVGVDESMNPQND